LAWVATRLFLALNGADVRVPSPSEGDEFVRAVAQGLVELADIARRLRTWQPSERD
jgi:death on curing protein